MRLFNSLTKQVEEVGEANELRLYSCGPTVYDRVHIGNLLAFIMADTLRRALKLEGKQVRHVMNITDIDDKIIKRSQERFAGDEPVVALTKLTAEYTDLFYKDLEALGFDQAAVHFVSAVDSIPAMQDLIKRLVDSGSAYVHEDGIYFSIEQYRASGHSYGRLVNLSPSDQSQARIDNDEYDKESAHDFALWKTAKPGEPSWPFELGGQKLDGRPGWHIECSAMAEANLGELPIDIHTGGIDLLFPHHENEIAQSCGAGASELSRLFVHNEHMLVDGRKMSKSLNNFYTLADVVEKGHEPLAFRLLLLQSHYRSRTNFSWESLDAAQNRLHHLRTLAERRFQTSLKAEHRDFARFSEQLRQRLSDDLDTPGALAVVGEFTNSVGDELIHPDDLTAFTNLLEELDHALGLQLLVTGDIEETIRELITKREAARAEHDWETADTYRDQLLQQNIGLNDTQLGPVWYRTT